MKKNYTCLMVILCLVANIPLFSQSIANVEVLYGSIHQASVSQVKLRIHGENTSFTCTNPLNVKLSHSLLCKATLDSMVIVSDTIIEAVFTPAIYSITPSTADPDSTDWRLTITWTCTGGSLESVEYRIIAERFSVTHLNLPSEVNIGGSMFFETRITGVNLNEIDTIPTTNDLTIGNLEFYLTSNETGDIWYPNSYTHLTNNSIQGLISIPDDPILCGSAELTYCYKCAVGNTFCWPLTQTIQIGCASPVESAEEVGLFNIWFDRGSSQLRIEFAHFNGPKATIHLYDSLGRIMSSQKFTTTISIPIESKGLLFYSITTPDSMQSGKFFN